MKLYQISFILKFYLSMLLMELITVYSYGLDDIDFGDRLPAGENIHRDKRPERGRSPPVMLNGN